MDLQRFIAKLHFIYQLFLWLSFIFSHRWLFVKQLVLDEVLYASRTRTAERSVSGTEPKQHWNELMSHRWGPLEPVHGPRGSQAQLSEHYQHQEPGPVHQYLLQSNRLLPDWTSGSVPLNNLLDSQLSSGLVLEGSTSRSPGCFRKWVSFM